MTMNLSYSLKVNSFLIGATATSTGSTTVGSAALRTLRRFAGLISEFYVTPVVVACAVLVPFQSSFFKLFTTLQVRQQLSCHLQQHW